MGKIRRKIAEWLLHSEPGAAIYTGAQPSGAGVNVSEDSAMRYAVVQACVRVLSEDIAALPLHVYERTDEGGKRRATAHPLYGLLHTAPNPEMTSIAFREALMTNLLLTGNAYAFIEYDNLGRIRALWPLLSTWVTPYRCDDGAIRYRIGGDTLDGSEILHIPGLGFDGLMGISPIAYARESIGLGVAAEQFGSAFFKNGTHLGGVITVPGRLDDQAFERTSREFKSMYRGLQNAHGIPVLEGGATFQSVGIAPEDAQFLETRKYQRSEIAGLFRVPPHLIGDLEHATFSNIEHQDISYLQRSLLPWLTRIEQGMNNRLLTAGERSRFLIEHDTGGFMRGDTKSRYEAYAIGITNGVITRNEARVRENLNPIAGGDELLQPLNMTTVGDQDAQSEPDGKRAFQLIDTRDFTSDRRRRAVMGKRDAAGDAQTAALKAAFARWLSAQADDLIALLPGEGRAKKETISLDAFRKAADKYYDALIQKPLPEDVTKAIAEVTDAAFRRVSEELPDESGRIDREWLEGFAERYYSEARERLIGAQRAAVERLAKQDVTADELLNLMKKLRGWGRDRAGNMARYERALAMNEALVAGYRASGYTSVWQSAPGCCKICTALNGRTVTTLKPPLHKGCVCTVRRGEKKPLTLQDKDGRIGSWDDMMKNRKILDNASLKNGLPFLSDAASITDKVDGEKRVLQRRVYGLDGRAFIDYDTSDHGLRKAHPTGAHKHIFDPNKKNAHARPLPLTEAELQQNADIIRRGENYYDP